MGPVRPPTMVTTFASVIASLTFHSNAYPLHWQVKDGCLENSTTLTDAIILYWEDDRACQLQEGNLIPGKYAWGMCGQSGIRFGYADTYEECKQSMVGEEGFHQVIVPPTEMTEGSCYCMPYAEAGVDTFGDHNMYSSYTCVKETTTTTSTKPIPHESKVYSSDTSTTPKAHEDYHHHDGNSIFILVMIAFSFALLSVLLCRF
jgi:hypothetical protein